MRRREFIVLLGSAAVIWTLEARAQKIARIPRVGVLWHAGSADEEGRYFTGFTEGLRCQSDFGRWPIPIVFIFVPDPVGSKFVNSFARPGGNATGLTHFAADLIGKRLQFLAETIPKLSRVALLVNPDTQVAQLYTNVTD